MLLACFRQVTQPQAVAAVGAGPSGAAPASALHAVAGRAAAQDERGSGRGEPSVAVAGAARPGKRKADAAGDPAADEAAKRVRSEGTSRVPEVAPPFLCTLDVAC